MEVKYKCLYLERIKTGFIEIHVCKLKDIRFPDLGLIHANTNYLYS